MSDQRDALLSRFRATLQARVRSVAGLFDALCAAPVDAELRRNTMGELHTLKGEARMLGLSTLSTLAHALETRVSETAFASDWARALDAMRAALDENIAPEIADAVLVNALLELEQHAGAAPASAAPASSAELAPTKDEPEPGAAASAPARKAQRWVQVDATHVDELCERMAELSAAFGELSARTLAQSAALGRAAVGEIAEDFARCRTLIEYGTSQAWLLRLVPVEPALRELSQHARSLAAAADKALSTVVTAHGVQIERDVLDQLWESLLHLVRNAVDHGIESADERGDKPRTSTLKLTAESAGANVVLSVEDDGRGIDPERVREAAVARGSLSGARARELSDAEVVDLIFEHGFSTRTEVTQLSGRGVGLDVVRRRLEALGGQVDVESAPGRGTRFRLSVPFTITKERVLVLQAGAGLYGLPARAVRAVLGPDELPPLDAENAGVLRHQSQLLPLVSLSRALELSNDDIETRGLVVEILGRRYGLRVARIIGERQLIRRPAERLLAKATPIEATALEDDGRMVLLLDLSSLKGAVGRASSRAANAPVPARARRQKRVLVADDSPVVRELIKEILVSAGCQVTTVPDGKAALDALAKSEPDLLMTDVEMPTMGGFDLLAEVRRRTQRLPVVMLTTRGSVEDRQRAATLGANAYVLKTGFKTEALMDVLGRFLRVDE